MEKIYSLNSETDLYICSHIEPVSLPAISRATAIRWNDEWQVLGCIQKIRHGVYKKIA